MKWILCTLVTPLAARPATIRTPRGKIGFSGSAAEVKVRAAAAQLGLLSFGEEKPTQPGQGEPVWALNRRVELVY